MTFFTYKSILPDTRVVGAKPKQLLRDGFLNKSPTEGRAVPDELDMKE